MSWLTGYLLNKLTEINSPVWEKSICLRKISSGDECVACVDRCPRKALQPLKTRVVLEEDRCSACGLCVQACPTQALGYEDEWFRQQSEQLRHVNQPVLTCERQPEKGHCKIGCLLGLHPEWLALMALEWGSQSAVFNLSGCESCDLGHHEPGFQESWQEVKQLLCALGKPFSLHQEKDADRIPEITLSAVNRRAWLTSLSSQARVKARETGRDLLAGKKRSGFHLREAFRDALIQQWPLQQDPGYLGGAFLSAFTVTEACDACGACERVCRRGAWQMVSGKETLQLTHEAGQCTDCGRCRKACSRQAITRSTLTPERLKQAAMLKQWAYGRCAGCRRKQLGNRLEEGLCTACHKRRQLTQQMAGSGVLRGSRRTRCLHEGSGDDASG